MTTLENSYCVPRDSEWDKFGLINLNGNIIIWRSGTWTLSDPTVPHGYKEIPVQHFVDLVEDRISVWRLGEVGFDFAHGEWYLCFNDEDSIIMTEDGQFFIVSDQQEIPLYITTFTDLLTLIKFLTPPTK